MWKYQSSFIQSISINCYDIFAFVVTLFVLCQFIWTLHTSVGRKKFRDRVNQRSMATFWRTAWRSQEAAGRNCLLTFDSGTSLAVQRLILCLPTQGVRVRSRSGSYDPTCLMGKNQNIKQKQYWNKFNKDLKKNFF